MVLAPLLYRLLAGLGESERRAAALDGLLSLSQGRRASFAIGADRLESLREDRAESLEVIRRLLRLARGERPGRAWAGPGATGRGVGR